jgi:hypothetical protein
VDERGFRKPDHLRRVTTSRRKWLKQRPFSLAACALGLISFIVVATTQQQLWSTPDWRISVPGFALTAFAALISMFRREHGPGFWALGVGIAGAALVLGWFMMLAVVIGVTFLLMLILSTVM